MSPVVDLILVLALMPVTGYALIGAWRGARWLGEVRRRPPAPVPVERLAADLRRLRAELADTETRDGLTAKQHRVRALRAAYLDALSAACERLGVEPPGLEAQRLETPPHLGTQPGGGVPLAEIYRAEAGLRARGLDVREHAAR